MRPIGLGDHGQPLLAVERAVGERHVGGRDHVGDLGRATPVVRAAGRRPGRSWSARPGRRGDRRPPGARRGPSRRARRRTRTSRSTPGRCRARRPRRGPARPGDGLRPPLVGVGEAGRARACATRAATPHPTRPSPRRSQATVSCRPAAARAATPRRRRRRRCGRRVRSGVSPSRLTGAPGSPAKGALVTRPQRTRRVRGARQRSGTTSRRDPRRPRQAADRRAADVRRRRAALRRHQRRPLPRPGPALAAAGARRRRPAAGPDGCSTWPPAPAPPASRSRTGARRSCRATSPSACSGSASGPAPALPFVAGDGTQLPFADATFDAVTISFGLRNIVDPGAGLRELLRVTRAGRPAGRLRVQPPDLRAVPHRLHRVPDARAAARRARRLLQPGRLRLPGGVDPRVARPGGSGVDDRRRPAGASVEWRNLSGGHRRPAPRDPTLTGEHLRKPPVR